MVGDFELPSIVDELLRAGTWPTHNSDYVSRASEHLVRAVLADESCFCLLAPPFRTLEQDENISQNLWWKNWLEGFRHPSEIDYSKAVMVADFGPGSENPIVLDYRSSPPQVMALTVRFHREAPNSARGEWEGHWVVLASTLEELLDKLGLP